MNAQPGTLDSTFGTKGTVIPPAGVWSDYWEATTIQIDGKVLVAGRTVGKHYEFWDSTYIAVYRYNTDGGLDNAFGANGKVTTSFGNDNSVAVAIATQSDGKIVVAGTLFPYASTWGVKFLTVRYNTNGTLDSTFGSNGVVNTAVGNYIDRVCAMAIQTDGKIVIAGNTYNGNHDDVALVRYNTNGTLDNTFGTNGIVTTPFDIGGEVGAIEIQIDGKMVLAGSSSNNSGFFHIMVMRYNANGALDSTFGTTGKVTTSIAGEFGTDKALGIAIQNDEKIVVGGYTKEDSYHFEDFVLLRYNVTGAIDSSFGANGIVITSIGNDDDRANEIVLQTDGKIIAVGYTITTGPKTDIAIARYSSNGTLDNTFGTNGIVSGLITVADSSYHVKASSSAIQNDGKLVVAGGTAGGAPIGAFSVLRYNLDGTPTGVFENSIIYSLKIFPNPAYDNLDIYFTMNKFESVIIRVTDIQGRIIYTETKNQQLGSYKTRIDLAGQSNGIYFVYILTDTETVIRKVVLN